ncbi:Cell division topological determinant MinJ [Candidatus Syntrophocurvum alkaliphilum]|uniref:Cell division topological determinant MinJ n=1 Tax=Candidatus Syntrophocurvum alkaliphilum TaxID=2293317 RepID=A0A6I6DHY0_9FIRM|nr:PDZ domain-containing protein [Candidatus Syntrophocurvum alkaliphilum]QGU00379.1 Cell division topological determinant MinJ [Candidatus Syntrophocurvum alkaliphilum]
MEFFAAVLTMMAQSMLETFKSPLYLSIYFLIFILVLWQYRKIYQISDRILNVEYNIYVRSAFVSTLFGLLGGIFGSILLVLLGIDLTGIGILYLWVIALLLMSINPRFLCFAYAGGILAISNILFGFPEVNVPQLMGLIAVLHMVESLLILLNGHLNPVPVYAKKNDEFRGGFNLQKFWPLPLIALIGMGGVVEPGAAGGLAMPDWWPLLEGPSTIKNQVFTLIPVVAVLGYGEIATTRTPRQAARKSALNLFGYSLILLLLAIIASDYAPFILLAALFGPLGHEFIIWLGMREEVNRKPIYVKSPYGVKLLDVLPNSLAYNAGVRSGDVIVKLNGELVENRYILEALLERSYTNINIELLRDNKYKQVSIYRSAREKLGIIPVPEYHAERYMVLQDDSIFKTVRKYWRKLKK